MIETLEERRLLATWMVTSTDDNGTNTLRWAIDSANMDSDSAETIVFQIGSGAQTITLNSDLPPIDHANTMIDGTRQPGYNGTPLIHLTPDSPPLDTGLKIYNNSFSCIVEGLTISGFSTGILTFAANCTFKSNFIEGNDVGVAFSNEAPGGTAIGNVISNNTSFGVEMVGDFVRVQGNKIGTTADGQSAAPNGVGVQINSGHDNVIGGTEPGAGNLISGNRNDGVVIGELSEENEPPHDNWVLDNRIGTTADASGGLGNGNNGVLIQFGAYTNNVIGNFIAGNGAAGVRISAGTELANPTNGNQVIANLIGTAFDGSTPLGNMVGVDIDGEATTPDENCNFNTVGPDNVISGNQIAGVRIRGIHAFMNQVTGNRIGTDKDGAIALGNGFEFEGGGDGVLIKDGATNSSVIGNLISGNSHAGVWIHESAMNEVQGNQIGTDAGGASALPNGTGVLIDRVAAHNTVGGAKTGIGNLISGNLRAGVDISGAGTTGNHVQGNLIGTDISGTLNLANFDGVVIGDQATDNQVGGTELGAGNTISGQHITGITITGAGTNQNMVQGNRIGTSANGDAVLSNGSGVLIEDGASLNTIGGTAVGAGNLISGNIFDGVDIRGTGTSSNALQGNTIGPDSSGLNPLYNGGDGVRIDSGANSNTIGGLAGNVIAFNLAIGVDVRDSTSVGNVIRANSIFDNGALGIDLGGDGVTPNTPGGPHVGPNDLQNYPAISDVTSQTVTFSLDSGAGTSYLVDFYANAAPDPSGHGEGRTWLGSQVVSQINASQTFMYQPVPGEPFITATATSIGPEDTSEFSGAVGPPQLLPSNGKLLVPLDNGEAFRLGRDPLYPQFLDLTFANEASSTVSIDPAAFSQVVINGAANDIIDIESLPPGVSLAIHARTGSTVNVSPSAHDLATIRGNLDITGEEGATLNLDDQAGGAGRNYVLTSNRFTWGSPAAVNFDLAGSLSVTGSPFNNTFAVQGLPGNSVTLHGGGGAKNTLIGPDTANTWMLAQPSGAEGMLNDTLVFDSFGSLIGGQSLDRFVVPDGASIPEFLSGGDGATGGSNNTLDLSAWTIPLTEHIMTSVYGGNVTGLSAGKEISVIKAFALCQNVIGGQSDDHFIFNQGFGLTTVDGGPGNNTLDFSPYFEPPSFLSPPAWVFEILGHDSGLVPGAIATYRDIQNLIGTKVDDRYAFRGAAYLDGTIDGQGGLNSLEYTQSAASASVNLKTGLASYINFQGGSTPQPGGIIGFQKVVGGPGSTNTLIGPDTSNTWTINGLDSGTLDGVYTFTGFQKLIGGASADTFVFQQSGSITGSLDGAAGANALDYSQFTGNIAVNLALNLASLVHQGAAGSALHIANVTGSNGNGLLVGDAHANVLIGGTGRNLLIGGLGSDTLDGSRATSDNILIGGWTDWDMNLAALNALFAEWTRTDLGFNNRRSDLLRGANGQGKTPFNQVNGQLILLTPATNSTSSNGTVHGDAFPDTLIGSNAIDSSTHKRAHNWFLFDALDVLINFSASSDRKNKVRQGLPS
jgi:hypothetical protein